MRLDLHDPQTEADLLDSVQSSAIHGAIMCNCGANRGAIRSTPDGFRGGRPGSLSGWDVSQAGLLALINLAEVNTVPYGLTGLGLASTWRMRSLGPGPLGVESGSGFACEPPAMPSGAARLEGGTPFPWRRPALRFSETASAGFGIQATDRPYRAGDCWSPSR